MHPFSEDGIGHPLDGPQIISWIPTNTRIIHPEKSGARDPYRLLIIRDYMRFFC